MIRVQEQISPSQLLFILIPLITATEFISVPGVIYGFAQEDAWVSYLLSMVTGIWCVGVFTTLASRHPGMTMVEYVGKILGKWVGKLVGLFYVYYLFIYVVTIADEIMSFITLFAQPQTPRIITLTLFLTVCGIAAWLGIEVIARCGQFLVPLSLIFIMIVSFLLIPDMNPEYLQPTLAHGWFPLVQGAVVPSGWAGEFFILGFLLPYVNNPQLARRFSYVSIGAVMFVMLTVILESMMVVGPLTGQLEYAYYSTVRYVSIGQFLERIDPVVLGVWVYNGFVKAAVFTWAFVLCTAQVFNFRNHRPLVVPLILLSIVGGLWTFSNASELRDFLMFTFPIEGLLFHNILPTVILLIDVIRFGRRGSYEQAAT